MVDLSRDICGPSGIAVVYGTDNIFLIDKLDTPSPCHGFNHFLYNGDGPVRISLSPLTWKPSVTFERSLL